MTQALAQLDVPGGVHVGLFGHESNWEALLKGEIHMYAEYIGTALHRYVNLAPKPRAEVWQTVHDASLERHDVEWLDPIGSDNTYGLMLARADAERLKVKRISDLAPHVHALTVIGRKRFIDDDPKMTFAPGGYEGFANAYGFRFGSETVTDDEFSANFRAFERGEGQVVADFVVHSCVELLDLVELEDDRAFFSNYFIAPVVRADFLREYPKAHEILNQLAWTLSSREMARINYQVDYEGRTTLDLASEFLQRVGLVPARVRV